MSGRRLKRGLTAGTMQTAGIPLPDKELICQGAGKLIPYTGKGYPDYLHWIPPGRFSPEWCIWEVDTEPCLVSSPKVLLCEPYRRPTLA